MPVLPRPVELSPVSAPPSLSRAAALSSEARLHLSRSAPCRRSSNARCSARQTPASCHSTKRRWPAGLTAAAHLGRHVPPLDAGAQHEEDPRQNRTVRRARSAALRLRRLGRQQRRNRPKYRQEKEALPLPLTTRTWVLSVGAASGPNRSSTRYRPLHSATENIRHDGIRGSEASRGFVE